ncbi:MmpS family transport accessory protein [Streptomyces sp. E11-3]|uniref:MmpS family transport accessory protein n=1 Tax=Streptomyces sp. E11-3 TaxID=3110112 RepID=UPI00397FD024
MKRLLATVVVLAVAGGGGALWWQDRQERHRREAAEAVESLRLQERLMEPRAVEYHLTGTAAGADLTWSDGSGQVAQATGKTVPLTDRAGAPMSIDFKASRGASLYVSAQNTGATGTVSCRIVVDGETVAENTSSGGYATVPCSATA